MSRRLRGDERPPVCRRLDRCGIRATGIEYATVAPGGASLEDHWRAPETRALVRSGGWEVVVLQQGRRRCRGAGPTYAGSRTAGRSRSDRTARIAALVVASRIDGIPPEELSQPDAVPEELWASVRAAIADALELTA